MKLSSDQIERLSERVFKVLKGSGHAGFDYETEERIEERVVETIANVLEEDSKMEDRLNREAERLVQQQADIAKSSGKSFEDLVAEVKIRLAKSKKILLGDGPDKADSLGEKVYKALWKVDGIDFFSDDHKVENCLARAIHRFRVEDDRVVESIEKIVSRKSTEEPYSAKWCVIFDRYAAEVKARIAAGGTLGGPAPASTPPVNNGETNPV